jgi:hypothetical protein
LSHVRNDATVDYDQPSPLLQSLVDCLREVVRAQPQATLPTLVLNGDVLELALADDNVAAMVFDRFVDLAFGAEPLFDRTVLYLPGNHDHHIWETAREHLYAEYVRSTGRDVDLEAPWHATRLFVQDGSHAVEAELLSALMKRRAGAELEVRVVYPNLGVEHPESGRHVIIHHGHFTESIYRLMSRAKAQLFPKQPVGQDVWDWEADNFAWIDFFWSTLGRSGQAGQDVGVVYDMLQDRAAIRRLAGELGVLLGTWGPGFIRPPLRAIGQLATRVVASRASRLERQNPAVVLSDSGREGLHEYLVGPVQRQIAREGRRPDQSTFIFGHTHKPFESVEMVSGFGPGVPVFNSGGWVVDATHPRPTHGASVLLIDEQCRVSALRMFNQADESAQYRVRAMSNPTGVPTDLDRWMGTTFDYSRPPWSDFSQIAARQVDLRCRLLPQIIARGLSYT